MLACRYSRPPRLVATELRCGAIDGRPFAVFTPAHQQHANVRRVDDSGPRGRYGLRILERHGLAAGVARFANCELLHFAEIQFAVGTLLRSASATESI